MLSFFGCFVESFFVVIGMVLMRIINDGIGSFRDWVWLLVVV